MTALEALPPEDLERLRGPGVGKCTVCWSTDKVMTARMAPCTHQAWEAKEANGAIDVDNPRNHTSINNRNRSNSKITEPRNCSVGNVGRKATMIQTVGCFDQVNSFKQGRWEEHGCH